MLRAVNVEKLTGKNRLCQMKYKMPSSFLDVNKPFNYVLRVSPLICLQNCL